MKIFLKIKYSERLNFETKTNFLLEFFYCICIFAQSCWLVCLKKMHAYYNLVKDLKINQFLFACIFFIFFMLQVFYFKFVNIHFYSHFISKATKVRQLRVEPWFASFQLNFIIIMNYSYKFVLCFIINE